MKSTRFNTFNKSQLALRAVITAGSLGLVAFVSCYTEAGDLGKFAPTVANYGETLNDCVTLLDSRPSEDEGAREEPVDSRPDAVVGEKGIPTEKSAPTGTPETTAPEQITCE